MLARNQQYRWRAYKYRYHYYYHYHYNDKYDGLSWGLRRSCGRVLVWSNYVCGFDKMGHDHSARHNYPVGHDHPVSHSYPVSNNNCDCDEVSHNHPANYDYGHDYIYNFGTNGHNNNSCGDKLSPDDDHFPKLDNHDRI